MTIHVWQYAAVCAMALAVTSVGSKAFAAPESLQVEEMTWPELKALMAQGYSTVIIPTGGTEQNGPHLAIGKHNAIVAYTSAMIAQRLGTAVVAPVIAYVPEGTISPADGHMQFPGTISLREQTFAAVLEDAARSFKQHGFKLICLLSDHGGSIKPQEEVAARLSKEWEAEGVRVLSLSSYYLANGQEQWVAMLGKAIVKPSAHAGFSDTSELLAVLPAAVRLNEVKAFKEADFTTTGVLGDPSEATTDYGKKLLQMKIDAAMQQIEDFYAAQRQQKKASQ